MIEFRNVTKTYEGGFTALEDINLQISDGECVFIVGGSGAGKSTLARLLIAEDKATSGSITVDGVELGGLKRSKIPYYRRKLGIVFRDFQLFPEKTVYENVAFALRVIGEHSASIRMKVNTALRMVELSEKSKCYPGELSGSEQQRVALARALANSPGVIIADEPCGNVDPVESRELLELFCRIQSRYEKTVVVLTHDRELADSFGKRMILLSRGKIAEDIAAYMPGEDLLAEMEPIQEDEPSVEPIVLPSVEPVQDDAVTERENVSETAEEMSAEDGAVEQTEEETVQDEASAVSEPAPTEEIADDPAKAVEESEESEDSSEGSVSEEAEEEVRQTVDAPDESTSELAEEDQTAPEADAAPITDEIGVATAIEAMATVAESNDDADTDTNIDTDTDTDEPTGSPEDESEIDADPVGTEDAVLTDADAEDAVPQAEVSSEADETLPETDETLPEADEPLPKADETADGSEERLESVPAVEEAPGVLSMTISTDALESVLTELFNGRSLDEVIPSSATTDETANSKEDGV